MEEISTKRLVMRRLNQTDLGCLRKVLADPEVMRFSGGVLSDTGIRDWIKDCANRYAETGYGPMGVIAKDSGSLIGYCGLSFYPDLDGRPETEIGYRLIREVWGNGYATEAVTTICDFAFESIKLGRLVAMIDPANEASIRVARKTGFVYEKEVMLEGYTHPDHLYVSSVS